MLSRNDDIKPVPTEKHILQLYMQPEQTTTAKDDMLCTRDDDYYK